MSDLPPQLGDIPHTSAIQVPTLSSSLDAPYAARSEPFNSKPINAATNESSAYSGGPSANGSANAENAKNTLVNARDTVAASAQQAANTIANHPVTQNVKDTISNAPVTQVAQDQAAKTSAEFDNLKASRRTPNATGANDQPLTHYHSFFYTLLSWENPRATGIAFGLSIVTIFAFRYVPALRWIFKSLYLTLGTVALIEGVTKVAFGASVAQSIRPRRYLTIPRESLEASLEDVEQLVNFFVIEFQRILYAENVINTTLAFLVSFISYYLIKFVPTWGLLLIGTSLVFTVPLIYITNQEAIDSLVANANNTISAQASQVKDIASQQTSQLSDTVKTYAGDYSAKAQELVGSKRSTSPNATLKSQDFPTAPKQQFQAAPEQDFPVAPKQDFSAAPKQDPIVDEFSTSRPLY